MDTPVGGQDTSQTAEGAVEIGALAAEPAPGAGDMGTGQGGAKVAPACQNVKQKAGEVVDQAKDAVKSQVSEKKETAAGSLGSVAQALRDTGERLREHDQGAFGDFAQKAADQVERISGYLESRDVDQLLRDAEDMARRQPALFMVGGFTLGFLASRFLKSSGQAGRPRSDSEYGGPGAAYERASARYGGAETQYGTTGAQYEGTGAGEYASP